MRALAVTSPRPPRPTIDDRDAVARVAKLIRKHDLAVLAGVEETSLMDPRAVSRAALVEAVLEIARKTA